MIWGSQNDPQNHRNPYKTWRFPPFWAKIGSPPRRQPGRTSGRLGGSRNGSKLIKPLIKAGVFFQIGAKRGFGGCYERKKWMNDKPNIYWNIQHQWRGFSSKFMEMVQNGAKYINIKLIFFVHLIFFRLNEKSVSYWPSISGIATAIPIFLHIGHPYNGIP